MRNLFFLSFGLFVISCEETDKESDGTDLNSDTGTPGVLDPDTGEEDTGTDECIVSIDFSNPEADSNTFFYRDPLRFKLSEIDDTVTVSLRSTSGDDIGEVTGQYSMDGRDVIFVPDRALLPETSYLAYVSTCDAETVFEIPFTTSSFGLPITEPLTDLLFGFNFGTGRMDPLDFQASLDGMVDNFILLSAFAQNGTRVEFHTGSSVDGDFAQDFCSSTSALFSPFDVDGVSDVSLSIPELPFRSKGNTVYLRNFSFDFTLAPNAKSMTHGYWTAEADMREFSNLLNQPTSTICADYLPSIGVTCGPCMADGHPTCIPLSMYEVEVEAVEKSLFCVNEDQCHADCEENLETCDVPQEEVCDQ